MVETHPDRPTGRVCALSAHEMTSDRVSHRQISPIKGQIVIYRPSIGPNSLREALRATFVGNHPESSGESRDNHSISVPDHGSTNMASGRIVVVGEDGIWGILDLFICFENQSRRSMDKSLWVSIAVVILSTALFGCTEASRAMNYCRDNYFGYTQSECERQLGARYRRGSPR